MGVARSNHVGLVGVPVVPFVHVEHFGIVYQGVPVPGHRAVAGVAR